MTEEPLGDDAGDRVLEILAANHVLTLACRDANGCWASAVFYAADGFDLLFVSSPESRHVRALATDDRPGGEIHALADDWRSIVGLQLAGQVEPVRAGEVDAVRVLYLRRFPWADGTQNPELVQALRRVSWYRYRVGHAVLIDNVRAFGQRQRWWRPAYPILE